MKLHRGRVKWLGPALRGKRALPPVRRYVGIGRFLEDGPAWPDGAWSVELFFEQPPPEQGSDVESEAQVRFLVGDAPHNRMRAGSRFELFEGPTKVADIEVLD